LKRYLLGQLADADEERVEVRLLTDPAFIQEFDMVVDEISAYYAAGQFTGNELEQVEKYFLRSPERRRKVKFMCELLRQVSSVQREPVAAVDSPVEAVSQTPYPVDVTTKGTSVVSQRKPNLSERVRAFFSGKSLAFTATTFAALALAIVLGIWLLSGRSSSPAYASLELSLSSPSRSTGAEIKKIKLTNIDELRIKLNLPNRTPPPKSYRADLRGENISLPRLPIAEQNAQSLTVIIPAEDLTRGTYAIEISAVNDNGVEEAVRGAYLFAVE
jgi:methionine-rich copper-binding protein CopC